MIELLEKRQENSKTFRLDNGQRQLVVSIGAVHYKDNYADANEQWKDIDLTWEGNKITKAPYELTLDDKKLTLRNKKTGEVSTIELLSATPNLPFEILPEFSAVKFRHAISSDKVPFEAKFKVTGKGFRTRAFDDEGELELETDLEAGILTEKLSAIKDKVTKEIRQAKGKIRIDPTWQVGASTDDCLRQKNIDAFIIDHNNIVAGVTGAAQTPQFGCGMRFTGIAIPQGATIDTAHFTLRAATGIDRDGTIMRTRISAEDVDDAPTFADNQAAFDTRYAARTAARVDWDNVVAFVAPNDYDSVDFKSVIQEIVDRGGWASGQDIVIFWDDFDIRSTDNTGDEQRRFGYSWDGDSTNCCILTVTYSTGWAAGNVEGVAAASIAGVDGVATASIAKVDGV